MTSLAQNRTPQIDLLPDFLCGGYFQSLFLRDTSWTADEK